MEGLEYYGWGGALAQGTGAAAYSLSNADSEQHSLLPDTPFSGTFTGDLKDWFEALVRLGRFTDATYVNIGNAG